MFFYVNIFISTEDDIAEKLLLFKIKFVVIFYLLIIYRMNLVIRLRTGFSHLREHKVNHLLRTLVEKY